MLFLHLVSKIYISTVCVMKIVFFSHDLRAYLELHEFYFRLQQKSFEFGTYDIVHESSEVSFLDDASSSILCFGRRVRL